LDLHLLIWSLQKLPQLETLHFQYLVRVTNWRAPDISVDLPHLSSISVTSSHYAYLCQVANHIRFPATARVQVRFMPEETLVPERWTKISESLLRFYPNFTSAQPSRVHIQTDRGKCHIACWYGPLSAISETPSHTTADFLFELDCSQNLYLGRPYFFTEPFRILFKDLGLASAPSLSLSEQCMSSLWQIDWARIFREATCVQELRVSHWIHSPLNAARSARAAPPLADGQVSTSTSPFPTPPLPALKKLIVANALLSDHIGGDFWALEQYLMYRWDRDAALEELAFDNCSGEFDARHLNRYTQAGSK
ncbi:hypothetical protein EVG20_g11362, partial [Dentipellis fragilis]